MLNINRIGSCTKKQNARIKRFTFASIQILLSVSLIIHTELITSKLYMYVFQRILVKELVS
jgi:hypothetical protein